MMAAVESSVSEEVSKLMGQGKRHLVCSEVVQAVKCFEEATQKLDNKYGAGSDECGEAYLFYGKALLELARAENGVLGNALKDVEPKSGESSDEDEDKMEAVGPKISEMSPSSKEKIREDVQEAMAEKEEGGAETKGKDKEGKDQDSKKEDNDKGDEVSSKTEDEGKDKGSSEEAIPKEGADEEMKEEEEEEEEKENKEEAGVNKEEVGEKDSKEEEKEKEEVGVNKEAGEKDNEGEEEDDEEGGEEEGEEEGEGDAGGATTERQEEDADVPTMQLAWEFLELARIVFLRHDNKEAQLNLAEVQLKLGEIQLEQEQFEGAVADFLTCLELQEKHLEPDNRLIAETAYNLGLAYSLQQNYAKAKEFYSKALHVIELKTTKLEARLAESESKNKGKGKATDDNPCVVDRKELEELQNLYPEIKARVDDAQEMMNSAANQPESTTEEGFGSSGLEKRDIPTNTIPIKQVSSQMPVTDVSHLVRRKRKPEEESSSAVKEDTGTPVKKPRQDEDQPAPVVTENGHAQN